MVPDYAREDGWELPGEGRATQAPRGIQLVTEPPRPKLVGVSPRHLSTGERVRLLVVDAEMKSLQDTMHKSGMV